MGVTPLTATQRTAVTVLMDDRRIESVPVDEMRAAAFLSAATERLGQLELLTSIRVKYDLAYDAAHDVGEALLAAHGLRTRGGAGQHDALGRFLRVVFDGPPADAAAGRFDRLRRVRNQSHYAARPVGATEAAAAEGVAREFVAAALALGIDP